MMTAADSSTKAKQQKQRVPKGLLSLNINLINNCADEQALQVSYNLNDTAYRHEGVSVGCDYLRMEGVTVTRGELMPSKLNIQEIIGRGAFSTVRRAQWQRRVPHNDDDTDDTTAVVDVAMKEFSLLDSSPQRRKMLLQELRSLAYVTHPTLVQMHGAFLHDNKDGCSAPLVTLVLEYMDQKSLEDLLVQFKEQRRGTTTTGLPETITAAISYQILCGLAYLHAPDRRIVHRDLKPGNVLLRSDGCVKLCDFGLAKLLREEDSLNGTVLGTTKYMSPERLRAKPYGRPSDVWSFGLIVWGCASADGGATPWCDDEDIHSIVDLLVTIEETSVADVMARQQQQEQESNNNNNNSATIISQGLQEIIAGCLHVDPLKRIPAHILLQSPWFSVENDIANRDGAVQIMCNFFHRE